MTRRAAVAAVEECATFLTAIPFTFDQLLVYMLIHFFAIFSQY